MSVNQRLRVLHTITTFPTSSGAAESTKLTLNMLDRSRFEPYLATQAGQAMDQELSPDVGRIVLRWLQRPLNPIKDVAAFVELYRVIRTGRFDIVHTHNAKDGILARWAAHRAGVPAIVHTIHNVSFQASGSKLANQLYALQERWAAHVTGRLLAVSSENTVKYLAKGIGHPELYRTVYSGLDLGKYASELRTPRECRGSLSLPEREGPWIAWLGRFTEQKDPLTFVRAARVVADAVPGVQFVVCGDDPLGRSLESASRSLATTLGLAEQMHFLGFIRNVSTVLHAVDLVMHSARYEGMGRVVCEALACGRPVAATAVDGIREVIQSGRRGGILVGPGNPRTLGEAAVELLSNRRLADDLARSGQEWVQANLGADAMVRSIESVYVGLVRSQA